MPGHDEAADIDGTGFYAGLPTFDSFTRLTDESIYTPLPSGWVLGLADIVRSTDAVEGGQYKAVNTAAAAVIAAVANLLPDTDFPFVFGGDGASFALPPGCAKLGGDALAAVSAWARDELGLEMRIALVSVDAIRAQGLDVRVARFAPSPDVSYAMFTGGGLAYAERGMKSGAFRISPAPPGARPDLTGLSCRFAAIGTMRGVILSLIVVPVAGADPKQFSGLIEDVLKLAEGGVEAGRPAPEAGPDVQWPPNGFDLEAKAARKPGRSRLGTRIGLGFRTLAAHIVFRTGLPIGSFDPKRYRRQLVQNTDFRKFDDGLRMTLDCTHELAGELEALLERAESAGIARCGTYRQQAALMTCFVPSATRSDHVHFVDGAAGGYAAAARAIKLD
jgi:hypothetical protein